MQVRHRHLPKYFLLCGLLCSPFTQGPARWWPAQPVRQDRTVPLRLGDVACWLAERPGQQTIDGGTIYRIYVLPDQIFGTRIVRAGW